MATTAFPINPALSAIAIAFANPAITLIADQVLVRVPTPKKFSWTRYALELGYTVPDTRVGRKSEPNVVDFGGTLVNDETLDYGLDDIVPNDEIEAFQAMPKPASGGPVDPLVRSTQYLEGLIQLDREIRVANLVFNSASYLPANVTVLSGTSQWSDFANSNPLDALLATLDVPVIRPNTVVLGQAAFTKLRQHPKVVQAVFGTAQEGGVVTREALARVLEVKQVLVGASFVNNARKGQAASMSRTWGKHCALLYIDEAAAQAGQPTFGFTAQWGTKQAGDMPEPKMGLRGSVRVRNGESVKEVITAQPLGCFIQNVVA